MHEWEEPARGPGRGLVLAAVAVTVLALAVLLRVDAGQGPSGAIGVTGTAEVGDDVAAQRAPALRPSPPTTAPAPSEASSDSEAGRLARDRELAAIEGEWTAPDGGPTGRWGVATAWTGAALVVVGGVADGPARQEFSAQAHRHRPPATWEQLDDLPQGPRSGAGIVAADDHVVLWGGTSAAGHHAEGAVLDLATGRWRAMAPSPLSPRHDPQLVWTGREAIVLGGFDNAGPLRDAAAYDVRADRWRRLADLPMLAHELRAETDGRVVVLWSLEGDLAVYDLRADRWGELPRGPGRLGRQLLGAGVVDGVVHVAEHRDRIAGAAGGSGLVVQRLVDGEWQQVGEPVAGASGGPGRLIAFGDDLLQTFAEGTQAALVLDPRTGTWRRIDRRGRAWVGWRSQAAWDGERLVIWGGDFGPQVHASFWRPTGGS